MRVPGVFIALTTISPRMGSSRGSCALCIVKPERALLARTSFCPFMGLSTEKAMETVAVVKPGLVTR
jgi:hypothetical protein